MKKYPKISVVTVVYNNENYIGSTIESVINQTYNNIEYVIIDGGSTDKTKEIIEKHIDNIDVFISERDKGIYDAMNKGIALCSGDFILFLNSGDVFYANESIIKLAEYVMKCIHVDIIYGDVGVAFQKFNFMSIMKSKNIVDIRKGMVANHQSCLINRELHLKYNYDLRYKLASDYHFILKSYLNGANIIQVPIVISVISDGGVSDSNRLSVFREKLKIKNELDYSIINFFSFCKESTYMFFMSLVKYVLPPSILQRMYSYKYKKTYNHGE